MVKQQRQYISKERREALIPEVGKLRKEGKLYSDIAKELGIGESTVKSYVRQHFPELLGRGGKPKPAFVPLGKVELKKAPMHITYYGAEISCSEAELKAVLQTIRMLAVNG